MGLNIKNERTHAAVRELARQTGQSQTAAVEDAVRRRLAELETEPDSTVEQRLARILEIAAEVQESITPEQRAALSRADEELYDEQGLPR